MTLELSYVHRGGEQPLLGCTLDVFFRSVVQRFPDQDAVVSLPQARRFTYAALDQEVERLAAGLLALGTERGHRVGIWSPDNVEWVLLQLATARIGAVLVNVNPACRPAELEHAMRRARVQTLFTIPAFRSSRYVDMLVEVCPELGQCEPDVLASARLPDLRRLVVYDPDAAAGRPAVRPAPAILTWDEVLARGAQVPPVGVAARGATLDPDDPISIQFTSGTTGFPKAVVLTHHNILNNAWFVGEAMGLRSADRLCVPVPFYHCFGMVVSNLGCFTHGAAVVIPAPHFEPGATLAAIEAERCTAVHGVPSMFIAELECPDFGRFDLSSLRTGIMAGAPCPPELMRRVQEQMGCEEILIGYGQTEASPVTHLTRPGDSLERRLETVGTNLPHQEVKVIDPVTGMMLPVGEQGEVCFRGYHVMRGYFEQPDVTAKTIDPAGWLHSGDLGVLDAAGYLRITGRMSDMIIRGGENVYPAEIEAFYLGHPKVADVAVFGVPSATLGEEVAVWFLLQAGETAEPEELRDHARDQIAHYKIPRHVWIVDEFPTTVTGKIQKHRMREIAEEWLRGENAEQAPGGCDATP